MPLISIRQYALHRGISHTAVRKAIVDERLKNSLISSSGGKKAVTLIDPELADREWPKGVGELQRVRENEKAAPPELPEGPIDEQPATVNEIYLKARAERETYNANLARIKLEEAEGSLVLAADVEKRWTEIASRVRTRVLGIASKAKQRVPGLTVHQYKLLDGIVVEALESLTRADDEPQDLEPDGVD